MNLLKTKKLAISRLVLPFSFIFCFFSSNIQAETFSDRFLMRISSKILSANDLVVWEQDLLALKCYMPDSLIPDYLGPSFLVKLKDLNKLLSNNEVLINDSHPVVPFLSYVRKISKLMTYIEDQKVTLVLPLTKELVQLSKTRKCPQKIHNGSKLKLSFEDVLRSEIYLRSKYLSKNISSDQDSKSKRFQALSLFIESVDRQISHENFW